MNTATAAAVLVIAKCRKGHAVKGTAVDVKGGWIDCPCGSFGQARYMSITIKESTKCGGRCTSSTGPVCNCSCGGHNHGSDLVA